MIIRRYCILLMARLMMEIRSRSVRLAHISLKEMKLFFWLSYSTFFVIHNIED